MILHRHCQRSTEGKNKIKMVQSREFVNIWVVLLMEVSGHFKAHHACTSTGLEERLGTSWHVRYSGYRFLWPWNSVLGGLEWHLFSNHRSHRRVRREHYSFGPHTLVHFTVSKQQVNRLAISPEYALALNAHPFTDMWRTSKRLLAAAIHKKVNIYEIASTSANPVYTSLRHISIHWLIPHSLSHLKGTLWMWRPSLFTVRESG
jgi:hypothetical protein